MTAIRGLPGSCTLIALLLLADAAVISTHPAEARTRARPRRSPAVKVGQWVTLRAGTFWMGSSAREKGRIWDEVRHQVVLAQSFRMKTTEVTQGEFKALMGYNPSLEHSCGATCPVEQVSWHEAVSYCNKLSTLKRLPACYSCRGHGRRQQTCVPVGSPYRCRGFRLPTEAEWEYAARAATKGSRYGPLGTIAWWYRNSGKRIHPVATKRANAWGLYDLLGNVEEWVHDRYGHYPQKRVIDPYGSATGKKRGVRGGAWTGPALSVRAAYRLSRAPSYTSSTMGFRPVRSVVSRRR